MQFLTNLSKSIRKKEKCKHLFLFTIAKTVIYFAFLQLISLFNKCMRTYAHTFICTYIRTYVRQWQAQKISKWAHETPTDHLID